MANQPRGGSVYVVPNTGYPPPPHIQGSYPVIAQAAPHGDGASATARMTVSQQQQTSYRAVPQYQPHQQQQQQQQQARQPWITGTHRLIDGSRVFDALVMADSWLMTALKEAIGAYVCALVYYVLVCAMVADIGTIGLARGVIHAVAGFVLAGVTANPVVSLAAMCTTKISPLTFLAHVVAQLAATLLAAVTAYGLSLDLADISSAVIAPSSGTSFLAEFLGTLILCFIAVSTALSTGRTFRAVIAGLVYFPVVAAFGPLTLAVVNPWIALSAEIVSGSFPDNIWVLYVGPVVGAVVAAVIVWIAGLRDIGGSETDQSTSIAMSCTATANSNV